MNNIIDPEAMKHIVAHAILEHMGTQSRDALITEALTYLITPPKDAYGRNSGHSPLQTAFNQAIQAAAFETVKDVLTQPAYKDMVETAIRDAVVKSLADKAGLSNAIGYAVGQVIEDRINEWD